MSVQSIITITFSPTGGTRSCVRGFCSRYPEASIREIDITPLTRYLPRRTCAQTSSSWQPRSITVTCRNQLLNG